MGTSSINGPFSMAMLNNQRVIDGNYGYFTSSQLKWAADVGLTKHLELSSSKANSVARLGGQGGPKLIPWTCHQRKWSCTVSPIINQPFGDGYAIHLWWFWGWSSWLFGLTSIFHLITIHGECVGADSAITTLWKHMGCSFPVETSPRVPFDAV